MLRFTVTFRLVWKLVYKLYTDQSVIAIRTSHYLSYLEQKDCENLTFL